MLNKETVESGNTIALVELYYKNEYLISVVFDEILTADMFIGTMQQFLKHRDIKNFSFKRKEEIIYDAGAISDEMNGTLKGSHYPEGTLMRIIRMINRREQG